MSGLWQNPAMVTSGTKILNPLNEFLVAMAKKRDLWIIGDGVHFERVC